MWFFFFLLGILCVSSKADIGHVSNLATDINCPKDPIRLDGTVQKFAFNYITPLQYCTYTFLIDKNDFANVSVMVNNTGVDGSVEVKSDFDTIRTNANSNFSLQAPFPPSQVTITVNSGTETLMMFGFTIVNEPLIPSLYLEEATIKANESADIRPLWLSDLKLSTDGSVSLIANAPPGTPINEFLNRFIFADGVPVGTIYTIQNKLMTLKASNITIHPVNDEQLAYINNYVTLISNHPSNLKDCNTYTTVWSYPAQDVSKSLVFFNTSYWGGCITILNEFDLSQYPTYRTINSHYEPYITDIRGSSLPIKFYVGAPITATKRIPLGAWPDDFTFPQMFPGFARTAMLNNGATNLSMTISGGSQNANAYIGRNGFISSSNYGFLDQQQQIYYRASFYKFFTFNVTVSQTNSTNVLNITTWDSENTLLLTIDLGSSLNKTFSVVTDSVIMNLWDQNNTGTLLQYSMSSYSPPTTSTSSTTTTPRNTRPTETTRTSTTTTPTNSTSTTTSSTTAPTTTTPTTTTITKPTTTTTTPRTTPRPPPVQQGGSGGAIGFISLIVAIYRAAI